MSRRTASYRPPVSRSRLGWIGFFRNMPCCTHPVFLGFLCRVKGVSGRTMLSWLFNFLKIHPNRRKFFFFLLFFREECSIIIEDVR